MTSYPSVLLYPTTPAAVPCFVLRESDVPPPSGSAASRGRSIWDAACTDILVRCAGHCSNAEIAARIAIQTGKRFSSKTVSNRRAAQGLDAPHRSPWTAPLRRWRPWQGRLKGKPLSE